MHYYKRHIGDYHKKAGRLSMLEHGSYTLLTDACYDREEFPTWEQAMDWCWARTTEEIAAVEFVLKKFFHLDGEVYTNPDIAESLEDYRNKALTNKKIAIDREEKRKNERARTVHDESRIVHEPPPNHKPRTKNQEPIDIPAAKATASTKKNPIEIKTFIDGCKESGQPVIPESDPIFDYADEAGIPSDHLRLCFREFVDRMTDSKTRKADWRAHFRNCVRGNWYKIWYIGENGYELTTVGKQAQLKHGRGTA